MVLYRAGPLCLSLHSNRGPWVCDGLIQMHKEKNAYALKTPHIVVLLTVILQSRFLTRHSIEIPMETFFDPVTLTFDL